MHMSVCKQFRFEAGHCLSNSCFNAEENAQVFGKCNSPHGHSYILEVFVYGIKDEQSGMVQNFSGISKYVKPVIEDYLDHKMLFLGEDVPSTAENILSMLIAPKLFRELPYCTKLRLWETSTAYAELTREDYIHV